MGQTRLSIELVPSPELGATANLPPETMFDAAPPEGLVSLPEPVPARIRKFPTWDRESLSADGTVEQIGIWLQRVVELQQLGAGSPEFYGKDRPGLGRSH